MTIHPEYRGRVYTEKEVSNRLEHLLENIKADASPLQTIRLHNYKYMLENMKNRYPIVHEYLKKVKMYEESLIAKSRVRR